MHLPESAREWFGQITERVRQLDRKPRIVFPEGDDARVIEAAARLTRDGLIEPILLSTGPDVLYQAALMVASGAADGMVGGAADTTADTVRAALKCIGPAPGVKRVSSCFIVAGQDRVLRPRRDAGICGLRDRD